jgi:hypothetical protein
VNPSTGTLDLNNGDTNANNNDCFIVTWVHKGSANDNLKEVIFWMKRTVVGGAANSNIRVALCDITSVANAITGEITNLGAGNHDKTPLTLDKENIHTAALAYAQVPAANIPTVGNGRPIVFELRYNSHETRAPVLTPGSVYCIIIYCDQGGADTDTIQIYGSQLAAHDSESATYFGSAGWNGIIAADVTVLSAWFQLVKTSDCWVNQIHLFAPSGSVLGNGEISHAVVTPDADLVIDNIIGSAGTERWAIEVVHHLEIGDQKEHAMIFEGKFRIPRRYFLKLAAVMPFTGDLKIELNYWVCPCGDPENIKW